MPGKIDDNRIGSSFNHLFSIMHQMDSTEVEDVEWDFSETESLNPFFLLPLVVYKSKCGRTVQYTHLSSYVKSYFDAIHFFDLLEAENEVDFSAYIGKYAQKRYIPMIKFPALKCKDTIKNNILSAIGKILKIQLNIKGEIYSALDYMLTELIDNITEHSESEHGYIFAQYYPKDKYIDICIIDTGITILGSYVKIGREDIGTDVDAIKNASIGVSTKNLPEAENRGYGIVTSKKMLTEGLGGQFFVFSGGAFYRKDSENDSIVGLPANIKWDGTVVLLRIPYSENSDFKYTNFLEV